MTTAICEPKSGPSPDTNSAGALILGFTASRTGEKRKKTDKISSKQLHNFKKESLVEIQSQDEYAYIAHLKDQLQEMKAEISIENHYMKRN